jgi:hypothetical protein
MQHIDCCRNFAEVASLCLAIQRTSWIRAGILRMGKPDEMYSDAP